MCHGLRCTVEHETTCVWGVNSAFSMIIVDFAGTLMYPGTNFRSLSTTVVKRLLDFMSRCLSCLSGGEYAAIIFASWRYRHRSSTV